MNDTDLREIRMQIYRMVTNRKSSDDGARYDTSDIVQEAILQVWRDQLKCSTEAELKQSWLWQVVKGHAAKLHRLHSAAKRSTKKQLPFQDGDSAQHQSADTNAEKREQIVRMLAAFDELPDEEQQVLFKRYFESNSIASIARELDLTVDIVRGRIVRGLRRLKKNLSR